MKQIDRFGKAGIALASLTLAACGNYRLPAETLPAGGGNGGGTVATKNCDELFTLRVQPRLDFCRNCHVPGGVADVPDGRLFLLSTDESRDFGNLRAAWENLGRNDNGKSRILKMASGTDDRSHSGGAPWPVGSDAYKEMDAQLLGFVAPQACMLSDLGGDSTEFPLLGSARGGHLWDDYCAGKPDTAVLPADPRTLVVPGVNQDKAVYMNAFWQTCQADDTPANCGEQRARVARGYPIVASAGQVGAGSFFSGSSSSSNYAVSASAYNSLWEQAFGLDARPDNFDQLAAERWGTALSPTRNPYPVPGENPNDPAVDGGSGQLPMALTQLRNADGSWTGNINVTCSACHGGQVGTADDGPGLGAMYGSNSLSDITVFFTDLAAVAPAQSALAVISQNKVRGTGNITNFQLFGLLTFFDLPGLPGYLSLQTQPSTGTEDPPVWWNVGHRPSKFYDAGQVTDSKRIELSFHFPSALQPDTQPGKDWILAHQQDGDAWITSLKSPAWPESSMGTIDTALAEQGAILFHSKNLWDENLNNPVARPDGGNGSCASCHGAYSPRYVHDPAFLDTPVLEGIAAYIVPISVIGTDGKRLDGNSQIVAESARSNWFAYSDGPYNEDGIPLCADQSDTALRGNRALGYLAPPLYGVWATAPYFHNGAVPNLWEVLQPADRKTLWRRVSLPARADQVGQVVMGFDSTLVTGYDKDKVGWNYEALACGVTGTMPYLDCDPADAGGVTIQDALGPVYANGGLIWNLANIPIKSNQQIEDRKIYNTRMYSQSNAGHAFTAVLTDQERRAIIEYLKTL
jgi:mono/diheme cytochrome c family protein